MNSDGTAGPRSDPLKHVQAAQWGRGFSALVRITRMTLRHPWQVAAAIAATFVAAGLQLAIPRLLGRAVDQAQGVLTAATGAETPLFQTALILLAVSVARGIFTMLQNYFGESVGHHVGYELRMAYYEKLQRLSFGFHDGVHTGDLITLGILDIDGVRMFFSTGLVRLVLLAVLIGVGAYILISTDVVLGLISLSFVPFVAWRSPVMQLRLRATWLALQERLAVVSRIMDENLGGIRVVRAFAAQEHELGKFDQASASALELSHSRTRIRVSNTSAMNFSFFLAMGLVLWVGRQPGDRGQDQRRHAGLVSCLHDHPADAGAPARPAGQFLRPRLDLRRAPVRAARPRGGGRRTSRTPTPLVIGDGVLRFEHVDFGYPRMPDIAVLSDVTFEAKRGQTIGIVGPPGSGKSTLAHLIPRFYDVTGGRITIDGQDIRDVTLESLRQAVAIVQQDSFLFTTTIENNIAYGDPWAKEQRIERASEYAQLHDYVLSLPMGYGTVVGERGVSLSGGQRQRLSIARILMLRPSVMIFDDSTAAIDAGTERRIRSAIRRFAADRVTIVISHRLSSLMHADKILFLEGGRIVEQGTHDELLALGGRYRALYDLQVNPGDDVIRTGGDVA